jgi:hypothetical protein
MSRLIWIYTLRRLFCPSLLHGYAPIVWCQEACAAIPSPDLAAERAYHIIVTRCHARSFEVYANLISRPSSHPNRQLSYPERILAVATGAECIFGAAEKRSASVSGASKFRLKSDMHMASGLPSCTSSSSIQEKKKGIPSSLVDLMSL